MSRTPTASKVMLATNMNTTTLRTIPTLLMMSLLTLCGVAAAGPLDVAGSATGVAGVSSDAMRASSGLHGALSGHLTADAKGRVDAQLPDVDWQGADATATATGDGRVEGRFSSGPNPSTHA